MIKFLFFDYRQLESLEGFERRVEPPRKHSAEPVMTSEQMWDMDWLTTYGSVVRRPDTGLYQLWYTTLSPKRKLVVAYAESADGMAWTRPALDVVRIRGRKTNIVFDKEPHGTAVIHDDADPRADWKYKMLSGAAPSGRISAFRSADGIHWMPAAENPVVGSNPDCPISFCRMPDGRFAAYHRSGFGDRRVSRTESWNFRNFSEAAVVMEPDQNDPPNTQFYGMGSAVYGPYMIGTLWVYHTDVQDMGFYKMTGFQQPEFVHSRGGYCWHRTGQGVPWIPVEKDKSRFDSGQVQPVSAPLFLEDEVRYYYTGTRTRHGAKHLQDKAPRPHAGIGFASCKPDRFVSVTAKGDGRMLTRPFWTETPRFCLNARVGRGGFVRAEVLDLEGKPIPGFTLKQSLPVTGDSIEHVLAWKDGPDPSGLANRDIRLRLHCRNAAIYSIYSGAPAEAKRYWDFRIATFLNMEAEKARM